MNQPPKKSPKRNTTTRRNYSDEFKAQALATLAIKGGQVKTAARALGIPAPTLRAWRDEHEKNPNALVAQVIERAEDEFVRQCELGMEAAYQQMLKTIPQAKAKEAATIWAIIFDKKNLHQGKPTSRVEQTNHFDPTEMKQLFSEWLPSLVESAKRRALEVEAIDAEISAIEDAEVVGDNPPLLKRGE